MKALRIHDFGGPEVMRIEDMPVPEPGEAEVLVRVRAAGINPVDFKTREGKFPPVGRDRLPLTLGRDVSGTVERAGRATNGFKEGEEIYAMLGPDRGAFAEYVIVKLSEAAPKPARLSHAEAAAVPLAALTAWQGLYTHGRLRAGQRLLVHGGAGGVGHFALQLARETGATAYATVSAEDMAFAREFGAAEAIDYKTQRFEDIAKEMDVVFDLVAGETQARSWGVLKPGGIMVSTLGQPDQEKAKQLGVRAAGFMVQPNGEQLEEIARLIDAGRIRPVVDSTFSFDTATEAEQLKQEGHVSGKIVLDMAA